MNARPTMTSFMVLALVEHLEPATAYDLKRLAQSSVFNFWALPHSVLYSETERLAKAGLLDSQQEPDGRRRRRYTLSVAGTEALERWRAEPSSNFLELRDPGLLQLFAGADEHHLATMQLRRHQQQLESYEHLLGEIEGGEQLTPGMRLTLEAGIGIEREYVRFWSAVLDDGPDAHPASPRGQTPAAPTSADADP